MRYCSISSRAASTRMNHFMSAKPIALQRERECPAPRKGCRSAQPRLDAQQLVCTWAMRSERDMEPVLIWVAAVATAMSAMV